MMLVKKLKQAIDHAFHKAFGLVEGGVTLNADRSGPMDAGRLMMRAADIRNAWARGDVPRVSHENLAQRQDDQRAHQSVKEAIRLACDWALGYPFADTPGYFATDALSAALRHLEDHQRYFAERPVYAGEFKPGEEGVYVALLDLHDIKKNGLDRAHARLRTLVTLNAYEALKDGGYAEMDAQANSDWQECVLDRHAKLKAAVQALVTTKHPKSLTELAAEAGVDFP